MIKFKTLTIKINLKPKFFLSSFIDEVLSIRRRRMAFGVMNMVGVKIADHRPLTIKSKSSE